MLILAYALCIVDLNKDDQERNQLFLFCNPVTVKLLESPGKAGGLPKGNYSIGEGVENTATRHRFPLRKFERSEFVEELHRIPIDPMAKADTIIETSHSCHNFIR
nr:hypothetical protein [uncultured Desulfobulbus sp.]